MQPQDITVLENFLPESYTNELEYCMLFGRRSNFNWYYNENTNVDINDFEKNLCMFPDAPNTLDSPQFTHTSFFSMTDGEKTSPYLPFMKTMLYFIEKETGLKVQKLLRIKANLITQQADYPDDHYHTPHIDSPVYTDCDVNCENYVTFLYYVNDSDGDTYLFDQILASKILPPDGNFTIAKRQTPKKGTGVLFNGSRYHASSPPRKSKHRMVINYMFTI